MPDINQNSITVEHEKESFTFRIPTIRDDARLDSYVKSMIFTDTQNPEIKESQLDEVTKFNYRVIAAFAILLQKSSALWPFHENPITKQPEVNIENLPAKSVEIYAKFADALNEYFRGTTTTGQPTSEQPVAGSTAPASQSV